MQSELSKKRRKPSGHAKVSGENKSHILKDISWPLTSRISTSLLKIFVMNYTVSVRLFLFALVVLLFYAIPFLYCRCSFN